jgi:hypothetical protein
VLQHTVDDAGPVEPGRDGEPPGDSRGLEPADLLHHRTSPDEPLGRWRSVVIAPSTRGSATSQGATPSVIRSYAEPLQDQDERLSVTGAETSRTGVAAGNRSGAVSVFSVPAALPLR